MHGRAFLLLSLAYLASGCDPALPSGGPDAGPPGDASTDPDGFAPDAPLLDLDGTPRLVPCDAADDPSRCASAPDWEAGRWHFHFSCPATSIWQVDVISDGTSSLRVVGSSGPTYGESADGTTHTITFTSHEAAGAPRWRCRAPRPGPFEIAIVQLEPALDDAGCDELCIADSDAGVERGCDCDRTCHDACSSLGTDCGLPCNRDVPGYACPFLETDVAASDDCTYYESDTGSFEHVGRCYRCGDGQQCCYTDGRDNGSGSYDLCPPLDPGANDPDPNGCSGVFDHCDCDVTPLCGCMAESGDLELCGECIGEGNLDVTSCNAPGDDGTFCQRALDATADGFSWCAIVGDVDRCLDRPIGF